MTFNVEGSRDSRTSNKAAQGECRPLPRFPKVLLFGPCSAPSPPPATSLHSAKSDRSTPGPTGRTPPSPSWDRTPSNRTVEYCTHVSNGRMDWSTGYAHPGAIELHPQLVLCPLPDVALEHDRTRPAQAAVSYISTTAEKHRRAPSENGRPVDLRWRKNEVESPARAVVER